MRLKRIKTGNLLQRFGAFGLKRMGWRIDGELLADKAVIIVAPHTSNWDFIVGILISFALQMPVFWFAKKSAFRFPFGNLMRRLGGIPVDRSSSHNMVPQVVHSIINLDRVYLTIAPEGRRRKSEFWKSGFYYIALESNFPVICASFDYAEKLIRLREPYQLTGEMSRDMDVIREFYEPVKGRHPENQGPVRLRQENE